MTLHYAALRCITLQVPPVAAEDPLFDVFKAFALFGKKGQG